MIDLFEMGAVVLLAVFGAVQLAAALAAAQLPLRVNRLPPRTAGDLVEGRACVHGELRAIEASLATIDGVEVVALRSALLGAHSSGARVVEKWARVSIVDATGACELDLDGVILLGEVRTFHLDADRLRDVVPELWSRCGSPAGGAFVVEQRFVPAGPGAFVAGEVAPGARVVGDGYRDGKLERLVVTSGLGLPLVVAARSIEASQRGGVSSSPARSRTSKDAVMRHLLGPALAHASVGVLAWSLAVAVIVVNRWIAAAAGL